MQHLYAEEIELTVVVPCRNGGATLAEQLRALEGQEALGSWEVVVSDNGSTDNSREVTARFADARMPVRVIDSSAQAGINHARNRGVQEAQGRFVLLCDADDVVEPGWLAAMWGAFREGAQIVGGSVRRGVRTTAGLQAGPAESGILDSLGFLPWPYGANCGFTREVHTELGGFDEAYVFGGEDAEFFWRAQLRGHALRAVSDAVIIYVGRTGPGSTFKQKFKFARSHVQLFAAFRARGMPRASVVHALLVVALLLVDLSAALFRPDYRRRFAGRLGHVLGRIAGSLRWRTLYL